MTRSPRVLKLLDWRHRDRPDRAIEKAAPDRCSGRCCCGVRCTLHRGHAGDVFATSGSFRLHECLHGRKGK